jgi:hypothetical protein
VIKNLAGVETAVGYALTKPLTFRRKAEIATSLLKIRAAELGQCGKDATDLVARACKADAFETSICRLP